MNLVRSGKSVSKKALLLCGVFLALSCAFLSMAVAATPAHAETASALTTRCIYPTFTYYPGSSASHLRYGQAQFHFEICSGTSPSSWGATARVTTNSTGKNLGITFSDAVIRGTSGGSYYKFYTGQFHTQTCVPRVGWPCSHSGEFYVKFYAYDVSGKPAVTEMSTSSPTGLTLFRTP
ncbi:hypothetical protein [Dictyobacter alpinus]|uniref:hypothetical protein n=1 Tax=Dictyobacter alpinus TaxID=2014873 RepID=UPI000F83C596|nr:hypothetical protein [Dictyobacter alpinus]